MVKNHLKYLLKVSSFALCASLLYSCGNSSSDGSSASGGSGASDGISGTAAIGAPLSNARVTVMGQACKKVTEANANGIYSVGLSGCEGPYLVRASSPLATVHSVARPTDIGKTVNVTPLTEVVAARTLATNDLKSQTAADKLKVEDNLEEAKEDVKALVQPLLTKMGADDVDILNGKFSANGQGLDRVLDTIDVRSSGSDMEVSVKGGTPVTVSTDVLSKPDNTSIVNDTDKAADTATVLDQVKNLVSSVNNCFKDADRGCFVGLSHTNFVEDGWVHSTVGANDDWWSEREIATNDYPSVSSPVVLKIDETVPTEPIVDLMVKVTWMYNGSEDGNWRMLGNGLSDPIVIEPTLVLSEGNIYRTFKIDHDNLSNLAADTTTYELVINGTSVTVTKRGVSPAYQYMEVPSVNRPACDASSLYCQSLYDLTGSDLPNFVEVVIEPSGVNKTIYVAAPSTNAETSDFASYNGTSSDFCGATLDTSTYPSVLGFSIPSGHQLDGYDIGPVMVTASFGFDFSNYNWDNIKTSKSFAIEWTGAGTMDVNYFNSSLTTNDSSGFSYKTIFGCTL